MIVINLTKHTPTAEQIADGAVEIASLRPIIDAAQDYKDLEDVRCADHLAYELASATECAVTRPGTRANIAGAAWLIVPLCKYLKMMGIKPVTSFSKRVCVETQNEDGTTTLSYVFKHEGWVEL